MFIKSIWYTSGIETYLPLLKITAVFALFITISINSAVSQNKDFNDVNFKKFFVYINRGDSSVTLPDKFLKENTISIYIDSVKSSLENFDVDYRFGKIKIKKTYLTELFSDTSKKSASVLILYQNFPYLIPDSYSKFKVYSLPDTLKKDTVEVAEIRSDFMQDIFAGSNLEKSGSIFRGFTLGNNRDLSLNSGFRLSMTGKLSKDIDIVAALTDENTPIQPEGNSQKLQELDKVFIELKSKHLGTTLGDIDVNFGNLEFFNFARKVQGAKGFANYGNSDFFVAAALSKGKFNTNTFSGIDGVQGPYRLTGAENEVNILIIAGSEKVYLDGLIMTRGETNDYTVDYSNGQITFTNKRLITNASRITIDFEYSDKSYSQTLIAGQTQTSLLNDRMNLSFSFLREQDSKDKPIDFTLSDSDKIVLANAGNDKLKASKSGVVYVGRDSLGHSIGQYIQADTIINSKSYVFYKYAPGDTNALYAVTFSFVGTGQGDYISLSTTSFKFAGIGQGSYLPIIFFPMPVLYQSGDVSMKYQISKSVSFNMEGAVSNYDRNLFSSLDKSGNTGYAFNSALVFNNDNFKIGKSNLGSMQFTYKQRLINQQYNSLDRLNEVEYNRVWDIQDTTTSQSENTSEAELKYKPANFFYIDASGGHSKRGQTFNSTRGSVNLGFRVDSSSQPLLNYYADYISSNDGSIDYKSKWIRQNGSINYKLSPWKSKFGSLNISMDFDGEDKQMKSLSFDTTNGNSYRFYELKPKLALVDLKHLDFSYQFMYRFDDVINGGSLSRLSNSLTHTYSVRLKDFNFLSSQADIVFYDKKYTPTFLSQGFNDNRTILVTSQSNLWFLNRGVQSSLFYKVSSEMTAKSQVVFQKVDVGQGNYIYLGDLNNNGIQDENEFQLVNYDGDYIRLIVPTDQLYPTTNLQTSATLNLDPSKIISGNSNNLFKTIVNNVSFDTYLSVGENSKDPKQSDIYLLRFSKFQSDENTIDGTNSVQQDINLFQNNKYFGIRLRFIQAKNFNQYYSGNERSLSVERSVRLRLSFTSDLTLQTDVLTNINRNLAPSLSLRNWNINGNGVISELTYIPIKSIEADFKLELRRSDDVYPLSGTQANVNIQTLKFTYSLESKGKLIVEVDRNDASLNNYPLYVPYELTKGIVPGKSYIWSVNFDYRITNFIQATVNYTGRAEGNSKTIHTGTAELRAYF